MQVKGKLTPVITFQTREVESLRVQFISENFRVCSEFHD